MPISYRSPPNAARRLIYCCFGAWFAASLALSYSGILDHVASGFLLLAGLFVPAMVCSLAYAGWPAFRSFVNDLPLKLTTVLEAPRVIGGTFLLWKFQQGLLPAEFAWLTGISDIIAGLSAIPAAIFLISREGHPKRGFGPWHIFSLGCLVASSLSGILTSRGLNIVGNEISSQALSSFPMNMVPIFLGPMMILFELASLTNGGLFAGKYKHKSRTLAPL